jgi:hypothetical protein
LNVEEAAAGEMEQIVPRQDVARAVAAFFCFCEAALVIFRDLIFILKLTSDRSSFPDELCS